MIYVTPFRASYKQTTGPSTDSGFASLDDVVTTMGRADLTHLSKRMAIYGFMGDDRVVFSDFIFSIDVAVTTG